MHFEVHRATDGVHKYKATFTRDNGTTKSVSFGAVGYSDFTQHRNTNRQRLYRLRHHATENWNDPETAGALSWHLLWKGPSFTSNVANFKRRFNLS